LQCAPAKKAPAAPADIKPAGTFTQHGGIPQ
jgi:hypothetical protein